MTTNFHRLLSRLLLAASLLAPAAPVRPAAPQPSANSKTNTTANAATTKEAAVTKPPARIKFRPPADGAPAVRLTGGSRGAGDASLALDVLAPDAVGLTTQEQPSLFWFQSKPEKAKFELTVIKENQVEPLCQVNMEQASKTGIQRLNLADRGVKLAPGIEYQWVVAVVKDPDNRSNDIVASGVIKRVEPSKELKQELAKARPESLSEVYAQAGIWYDALTVLSDQIDSHPQDKELRQARADLLAQVRLTAAAAAEVASINK